MYRRDRAIVITRGGGQSREKWIRNMTVVRSKIADIRAKCDVLYHAFEVHTLDSVGVYYRQHGADTGSYDHDLAANGIEIEQSLNRARNHV